MQVGVVSVLTRSDSSGVRTTERDLLFLVLADVQQHVQEMRAALDLAHQALDPLRGPLAGMTAESRANVEAAAAGIAATTSHMGDVQGILAAAAQSLAARLGAEERLQALVVDD